MRLVVLGSNSFTGSHVVANALQKGDSVLGISRSPEPNQPFLPRTWNPSSACDFSFIQADLNSQMHAAVNAIRDFAPEVVLNFAAQSMVAQSWDSPEHWYQTNVVALARLVKELEALPTLERYVHVTTPEVYGSTSDWVSENQIFAPSTPYAVSRAAGDWHLLAMHKARHFPVVFTRAANVFGPGQQLYRIVPKAALYAKLGRELPLHGGGMSRRSFIHVDDVAAATLVIAQRGTVGSTYHISTDELVTIRDLVAKVFEIAGVDDPSRLVAPVDERLGKDLGYFLDSSRLREELGWRPLVDLEAGIRSVVTWIDANIDELIDVPSEYVHRA